MKTHYPTENYEWGWKYRVVELIESHRKVFWIEKQFLFLFWIRPSTRHYDSLKEALEALEEKLKPETKKLYHYVRHNYNKEDK